VLARQTGDSAILVEERHVTTKIAADMKNGVLKIHMPKTGVARAKGRKIEIVTK
jgi:HSP20 family molecular chaperone IbpA